MDNPEMRAKHAEAVIGFVLLGIGALVLLAEFNVLDDLFRFWPVVLIGFGIAKLVRRVDEISEEEPAARKEDRYGTAHF